MKQIFHISFLGLTVAAMLTSATPVWGQIEEDPTQLLQLNTITTAVPFLMIAPDSRSGAMGDVGVALSPDANSMHWNPAKMAFSENEVEMSMSYAPWLRALVDDMNLAYVSSVRRLNKRQAYGVALRYFSLGNITFTDEVGTTIRDFQPAELSLDGGFSQKFSDKFSGGFSARFIHSNLTGGTSVQGADSRPGISVAADLSMYYVNDEADWGSKDGIFSWGMNMSNLGAKMSYTETTARDFIPSNLRLGAAYETILDDYNSLTIALDANKLLVPTQPCTTLTRMGPSTFSAEETLTWVWPQALSRVFTMLRASWWNPPMETILTFWREAVGKRSCVKSTLAWAWNTILPMCLPSGLAISTSTLAKATGNSSHWVQGSNTRFSLWI